MRRCRCTRGGFSLLEVVIVVAIIAILAAIGIPRMSRGAKGASDAALTGDLATLRNAIDLYAAEHAGAFPTAGSVNTQLTQYTNISGGVNATKTTAYIYGPYMRSHSGPARRDEEGQRAHRGGGRQRRGLDLRQRRMGPSRPMRRTRRRMRPARSTICTEP